MVLGFLGISAIETVFSLPPQSVPSGDYTRRELTITAFSHFCSAVIIANMK